MTPSLLRPLPPPSPSFSTITPSSNPLSYHPSPIFLPRTGVSVRVTETGLTKLPGIFISRLVPGGLAESTGLLSVNDEVLEVNGIEVAGKTLDQVTDMMIANSSNLIITVRPRFFFCRGEKKVRRVVAVSLGHRTNSLSLHLWEEKSLMR